MKFFEYIEIREEILLERKKKKNWIQKAIKHPGRCADMGSKDCPEGSPQYNLAIRFKSGEFKHKKKD
jgi:hypothetical protein